eukprot:TRINITY_DN2529_c0_g1_i1.p1 TRINITY_DN2529_c0_g1~~TRINITY_DN2529_c0_g1_i1.p1  ORF type:complete len:154 (+),score=29.47 TRINITY_DN2529_c0_g1_i1:31-462(+)
MICSRLRTFSRLVPLTQSFYTYKASRSFSTPPSSSSSPPPPPHQWLVIAKDGTDADALKRRMAARPVHMARAKAATEAGSIVIGGAVLDEKDLHMVSSMLVIDGFATKEEVRQFLKEDPYTTMGVWQDIQILPFRFAVLRGQK